MKSGSAETMPATSSQQTTPIPTQSDSTKSPTAADSANSSPQPSLPLITAESASLPPSPLMTAESANADLGAILSQTQIHESSISLDGSGGVVPASPFPQPRASPEESTTPANGGVTKSESGPVTPSSSGLLSRLKKWQGVESKVRPNMCGW